MKREIKLYEPKKLIKKLTELVEKKEYLEIVFKGCYLMGKGCGWVEFDTRTRQKYKFKLTYPGMNTDIHFNAAMVDTVAVMVFRDCTYPLKRGGSCI